MHTKSGDEIAATRKLFPKWSRYEQDWWMDTFQMLAEQLVQSYLEETPTYESLSDKETEYYVDRIRLAAKLADEATKEMIYRFERQQPLRTQARMNGERQSKKKTKVSGRWFYGNG